MFQRRRTASVALVCVILWATVADGSHRYFCQVFNTIAIAFVEEYRWTGTASCYAYDGVFSSGGNTFTPPSTCNDAGDKVTGSCPISAEDTPSSTNVQELDVPFTYGPGTFPWYEDFENLAAIGTTFPQAEFDARPCNHIGPGNVITNETALCGGGTGVRWLKTVRTVSQEDFDEMNALKYANTSQYTMQYITFEVYQACTNSAPCLVVVDCSVTNPVCSACSTTCGTGTRSCTRAIIQNAANGGDPCPPLSYTESCVVNASCQDCAHGPWECDSCALNGDSCQSLCTRNITVPQIGAGQPCGNLTEYQSCDADSCNRDCAVETYDCSAVIAVNKTGNGTDCTNTSVAVPRAVVFGGIHTTALQGCSSTGTLSEDGTIAVISVMSISLALNAISFSSWLAQQNYRPLISG